MTENFNTIGKAPEKDKVRGKDSILAFFIEPCERGLRLKLE